MHFDEKRTKSLSARDLKNVLYVDWTGNIAVACGNLVFHFEDDGKIMCSSDDHMDFRKATDDESINIKEK